MRRRQVTKKPCLTKKLYGELDSDSEAERQPSGNRAPALPCLRGQRTNPNALLKRRVTEADDSAMSAQRMQQVNLIYPVAVRESARSRTGWNCHLRSFVEFISVNVGGFQRDAKVSSLPMP